MFTIIYKNVYFIVYIAIVTGKIHIVGISIFCPYEVASLLINTVTKMISKTSQHYKRYYSSAVFIAT